MKLTETDKHLLIVIFLLIFSFLYNLSIKDSYLLYIMPLLIGNILLAKILNTRKDNKNTTKQKGEK